MGVIKAAQRGATSTPSLARRSPLVDEPQSVLSVPVAQPRQTKRRTLRHLPTGRDREARGCRTSRRPSRRCRHTPSRRCMSSWWGSLSTTGWFPGCRLSAARTTKMSRRGRSTCCAAACSARRSCPYAAAHIPSLYPGVVVQRITVVQATTEPDGREPQHWNTAPRALHRRRQRDVPERAQWDRAFKTIRMNIVPLTLSRYL